jgi:hypothetical protein
MLHIAVVITAVRAEGCCYAPVISAAGTGVNAIEFPPLASRPVRAALLMSQARRMKLAIRGWFSR